MADRVFQLNDFRPLSQVPSAGRVLIRRQTMQRELIKASAEALFRFRVVSVVLAAELGGEGVSAGE